MKKIGLAALFFFNLISCQESGKEKFTKQVESLFNDSFLPDEPGGAVLIMKGEKIIFSKGYGVTDINTKEKITTQTLFNTGSITKTFVSNIILSLAEENKLSLTDSLFKYFPDFKNKEIAQKVRIHHLLTHTSGLPDNRRDFLDSVALLTAKDEDNFAPIKQADTLLFEPGFRYEYSNPAFNGLALIIEKVTGKKWQQVVAEKIFAPAGMKTSKITDGSYPQEGVSHGYLKFKNKYTEKDYGEEPTFAAAGNGGVWSSAEELAKYEIALRKAVFLKKETIERSRTITTYLNWKDVNPEFIGFSWFISKTEDSVKVVSHTGTQGGFYADYVSFPEKELLYVILCNKPFPRERFNKRIMILFKENNWLE